MPDDDFWTRVESRRENRRGWLWVLLLAAFFLFLSVFGRPRPFT